MQRIDFTGVRMSSFDADEAVRIVEDMIPQELLDSTLDEILETLFNRLDGPHPYPEGVRDTRPFTSHMRSRLPALVDRVVDSLWPLVLAGTIAVMMALGALFFGDGLPQVMIRNMGAKVPDPGPFMDMLSVLTSLFSEVGRNLLKQAGWMVVEGSGALVVARNLAKRGVGEVSGE